MTLIEDINNLKAQAETRKEDIRNEMDALAKELAALNRVYRSPRTKPKPKSSDEAQGHPKTATKK